MARRTKQDEDRDALIKAVLMTIAAGSEMGREKFTRDGDRDSAQTCENLGRMSALALDNYDNLRSIYDSLTKK